MFVIVSQHGSPQYLCVRPTFLDIFEFLLLHVVLFLHTQLTCKSRSLELVSELLSIGSPTGLVQILS